MKGRALILEAFAAGFYVNITRSLAPIFMAAMGLTIKEILLINLYSYFFAFLFSAFLYKFRKFLLINPKKYLFAFHFAERVFWCSLPIAYSFDLLFIAYPLAVISSIPTSAFITLEIHAIEDREEKKKVLYYRSALSALSNMLGAMTTVFLLFVFEGAEKYLVLYSLAFLSGIFSSILVLTFEPKQVKIFEPSEEARVRYANVLLFVLLLNSSSAIIGATWAPYVMKRLSAPDYLAASLGTMQTLASIISPIFWAKRSYRDYRLAIATLSAFPILIFSLNVPELHVALAFSYAFLLSAANILSSFLFAEISEARDRLAFLSTTVATLSQLLGMSVAYSADKVEEIFIFSSLLLIAALLLTFFTIPETAIDPERARIYSRAVYTTTIQGYSFSIYVTKEVSLLALRLIALVFIIAVLTFLYRFAYYLAG